MAAKIQDGGQKKMKIKTFQIQKHIIAFTCFKFGRYVVQTLRYVKDILDIQKINIQYNS